MCYIFPNGPLYHQGLGVLNENEVLLQEADQMRVLDLRTCRPVGVLRATTPPGAFCVADDGQTAYSIASEFNGGGVIIEITTPSLYSSIVRE